MNIPELDLGFIDCGPLGRRITVPSWAPPIVSIPWHHHMHLNNGLLLEWLRARYVFLSDDGYRARYFLVRRWLAGPVRAALAVRRAVLRYLQGC